MAQSTKTFNGNGQSQVFSLLGNRDAVIVVTGNFVATLVPSLSKGGGAAFNPCAVINPDGTISQSITAPGTYIPLGTFPKDQLKLTTTSYTSGAAVSVLTTR